MDLYKIYNKLNLTPENGLYITGTNNWKGKLPKRVEFIIETKLKPEAFFCFDNKPLILFYDSPLNKQELFKAIWNFNESPIVIINEPDSIEIFNGFSYLEEESILEKLEDSKNLGNFSYFDLVTGKSLKQYQTKLKQQNRIDYYLLSNIRDARDMLVNELQVTDYLANALIGKSIFVRYLIDRGVKLNFKGESKKWTNDEFCGLFDDKTALIEFFNYLKAKFNGEAFLIKDQELKKIPDKAFTVLEKLLKGTQLASGQQSLFDVYDFSIIPVEFISNVYEFFIGLEKQAKKGAYYTPKFLVDYILTKTVEEHFKDNPTQYNCKVLDPSCGSGIFLVEALRRIIERYKELHNGKISKKTLKKLTEDNIFGIDKDKNAINVAIFSIYLSLLDYQDPKDITDFTFPNLIENGNFFTADFFDTQVTYNTRFSKIDFDFIIGNPPWKRGASQDDLFLKYITIREQKESNKKKKLPKCIISNKEIAQAFLLRVSDFSSRNTQCALIVTSKTLYNLNAEDFRKYFLHNFFIKKIFELAPVRREIFDKSNDKAIAPAAILFFRYAHGINTESNTIIHLCLKPNRLFSLFRIFVLQKTDIKKIVQKRLMEYDWLWKVLVYGSYLDFNLLKRLKEEYKTIWDIISDKEKFFVKQGLKRKDGDKKINVPKLIGLDFLDINKKGQMEPFFIKPEFNKWKDKEVGYIYRDKNGNYTDIFTPPILLIKGGVKNNLESISAVNYQKAVFKSSLTGIKNIGNNVNILRMINALLNSSLFSYHILQTGSSAGIEREESEDKEKWDTPFTDIFGISGKVKKIENISKQLYLEKQKPLNSQVQRLESQKKELINQLNKIIFNGFELNEQELALIDYAIDITIPLIMKHKGYENKLFAPIPFKDNLLNNYVKIFLSRFKNSFDVKHLTSEIWHTADIIGIFFKVVPNGSAANDDINWKDKNNDSLLEKIASLGTGKITENLFIQKDIRGFEKDGFYVIKPNEKKLWHKAIAYLDVDEFMDAILKAGKEADNV